MTELSDDLARSLQNALTAHKAEVAPGERAERHDERMGLLEHLEGEAFETIRQMIGPQLAAGNYPDGVKALVDRVLSPEHPIELGPAAGILIAIGYIIGQAAMAGVSSSLAIQAMRDQGDFAIDPGFLASAAITGRIPLDKAISLMADSGLNGLKVTDVIDGSYATLSIDQWLTFWNRYPGEADVAKDGLRRNSLDGEAMYTIERLRQGPPGAELGARAVTQNQIDMAEFATLLSQNGIDPKFAQVIYETEGQTMPPQMANELFRRGFIDQPAYEQILLESTLKNKYVPLMKDLRWRVPPMRQTISAFHNGSIDRVTAAGYLSKLGFDVDVQQWMLDSAAKTAGSASHHLSMQQNIALYEAQLVSRQAAHDAIVAVGWPDADVNLELDLADHRKIIASQTRSANQVGTRYVGWKIDRNTASQALDALQIPAAARDSMLTDWDLVRETRTAHLTEAFMKKAHKAGHMSTADVLARLRASGYDQVDADLIIATDFT